eukprot:TRINITY_DN5155_c0_g1_i20.p2 TRINITY_DN5155_c0_g1~~TRINITY_DN5155_c0_g1_i20.p2  ORF type:complete len:150 (+),score=9.44 TRINITY_DN5155_c0_g1_i20:964-1413(+)
MFITFLRKLTCDMSSSSSSLILFSAKESSFANCCANASVCYSALGPSSPDERIKAVEVPLTEHVEALNSGFRLSKRLGSGWSLNCEKLLGSRAQDRRAEKLSHTGSIFVEFSHDLLCMDIKIFLYSPFFPGEELQKGLERSLVGLFERS